MIYDLYSTIELIKNILKLQLIDILELNNDYIFLS